jgi:transposase InsO family protein
MNHKKVLRLMKKYNLLSKVRKRNPYKQIAKANQEHRSIENILSRNFSWVTPLQKLWTDISYLYYNGTKAYISVLKDMVTWEVISHKVSSNLSMGFVLDTIQDAKKQLQGWGLTQYPHGTIQSNLCIIQSDLCIIQSDQWFHYTHPSYQCLLKDMWIVQSMSRRWNCLDNAPTESFFGHMKDEIDISDCKSLDDLEKYIENYIFHYNHKRPQWSRKKMTPVEYRNHLLRIQC